MAAKFNPGYTAYLVESNRFVREVVILKSGGGFYTIQFRDSGGGIKVRENRLFATREEAESAVSRAYQQRKQKPSPWDYI